MKYFRCPHCKHLLQLDEQEITSYLVKCEQCGATWETYRRVLLSVEEPNGE